MKWRGLIIFCGCITTYFGLAQNTLHEDLSTEINRRIELKINQGISVSLVDSNQQIIHFYFGLESEKGKPISKTSTFEIASITKTFSAALFYQYHQEGLISLDNEVREYLPDSLPEYIKQIRIRELLNHTSGLPKLHEEFWTTNWDNPYYDYSENKLMSHLMTAKLGSNERWRYSNLGYALLGYIALKVNPKFGLDELIDTYQLNNTTAKTEVLASTTPHNFGHEVSFWQFPEFNAFLGGIKSNGPDLANYLIYQLSSSKAFQSKPYSAILTVDSSDSLTYRNSWLVFYKNQEQIVWHNGVSGGFSSFVGYNLQQKKGIVILSNSASPVHDIGLNYLSTSFPVNHVKSKAINEVDSLIKLNKIDLAINAWQNADTSLMDKSLADIYWLQCHSITVKNYDVALKLNQLILEEYPNDWETLFYRSQILKAMGELKKSKRLNSKMDKLRRG